MAKTRSIIINRAGRILSAASFTILLLSSIIMAQEGPIYLEVAPGQSGGGLFTLVGQETEIDLYITWDNINMVFNPNHNPSTIFGTLTVNANGPWKIWVSTDTGGYATEYDSIAGRYVPSGKKLNEPMILHVDDKRIDLSKGGILLDGSGDKTFSLIAEQNIGWIDEALSEGHTYHTALVLNASGE